MKLLLINTTANSGSTGRIAEEIGQSAIDNGYDSYFAYGRLGRDSQSHLIKIGNKFDIKAHIIESRLFDNHGFASRQSTIKLVEEIKKIKPDIINIHNLHGYYLNVEILFRYLAQIQIPIVWTLHDCWPFTGHCSHFMRVKCERWKSECFSCPNKKGYPASYLLDRSTHNYNIKKRIFTSVDNVTIVTPSKWLESNIKQSFLKQHSLTTIYNGTDLNIFKPTDCWTFGDRLQIKNCKVILGVASVWTKWKGIEDFLSLSKMLSKDYRIILVGLNDKQISSLPENIIGVKRTENVKQLAELYSIADVFVNPTYVDNFPTTNIEALACGTPVITYKTGGSPESIDLDTGIVIEQGNILQLKSAIEHVASNKELYTAACRKRAEKHYDKNERFNDYVELFNRLTK